MTISLSEAIELYKRYRHDMSLLLDEKRYVMEAYWKHCKIDKEHAMNYQDWLFDYYFSRLVVKNGNKKRNS